MKPLLKMFPIAVVAALMALAMTAGTASATVLCKNESSPCTEKYGAGTELKLSLVGTWVLHPSIGTIECGESTLESKIENAGGSETPVSGSITTLTFGKCNATVSVLKKGKLIHHAIKGTKNSTTTLGESEITVEKSGFHCIYGVGAAAIDLGEQTNKPLDRRFHWRPKLMKMGGKSGVFCGSEAESTAEYEWTAPATAYWSES